VTVSVVFASGNILTAESLNTAFSEIDTQINNITNAQISPGAGITSDKLSDRYAVNRVVLPLIPAWGALSASINTAFQSTTEWQTPTETTPTTPAATPTARPGVFRYYPMIRSNRRSFLCGLSVFAQAVTDSAGSWPRIWTYLNSTLLTGAPLTLSSASGANPEGPWYLRAADQFSQPLIPIQEGDFIEIQLGRSSTDGTPTWLGLSMVLLFKEELGS
jgi:hypothetical protein